MKKFPQILFFATLLELVFFLTLLQLKEAGHPQPRVTSKIRTVAPVVLKNGLGHNILLVKVVTEEKIPCGNIEGEEKTDVFYVDTKNTSGSDSFLSAWVNPGRYKLEIYSSEWVSSIKEKGRICMLVVATASSIQPENNSSRHE